MFRKTAVVVMAMAALGGLVVACEGPIGKSEGDSCNSNDSCDEGLVCQPIGDGGDYCCPTPATASTKSTCKSGNEGNGS